MHRWAIEKKIPSGEEFGGGARSERLTICENRKKRRHCRARKQVLSEKEKRINIAAGFIRTPSKILSPRNTCRQRNLWRLEEAVSLLKCEGKELERSYLPRERAGRKSWKLDSSFLEETVKVLSSSAIEGRNRTLMRKMLPIGETRELLQENSQVW